MTILILLLLPAALFILLSWTNLQWKRRNANIRGWVIDSDLDGKGKSYRNKSGIVAKPDVVIDLAGRRRVIERKNGVCNTKGAYKGDLIQVAAEMEVANATEALLIYSNGKTFRILNTPELRKALGQVQERMLRARMSGKAPEATPSKGKCEHCDFNNECPVAVRT